MDLLVNNAGTFGPVGGVDEIPIERWLSTVAVNLAVALAQNGAKVGLMDADVYGPNVPLMLGAANVQPQVFNGQLVPVEAHGIKMISMAVLVPPDKPMILRGPMLHGVVRQFLSDVNWGELDYLIDVAYVTRDFDV